MLTSADDDLGNGDLACLVQRVAEEDVGFVSAFAGLQVVRLVEEQRVHVVEADEVHDVNGLSRFDIHAREVLFLEKHELSLFILIAFDDLIPWDLFPVDFGDTLVVDRTMIAGA
jgi:hypothetical protein